MIEELAFTVYKKIYQWIKAMQQGNQCFICSHFAEFERHLIKERSVAGRIAARARGRLGGCPEKYREKDIEMMKALIKSGTPNKDLAEKWGVSRTTIYRYLEKNKSFLQRFGKFGNMASRGKE